MSSRLPAHVIFANIKEGVMPRDQLTVHQRKLVTQFLRYESNYTINKIAEFLQITPRTVWNYTRELTKYAGQVYAFQDTEKYARQVCGELKELKERARSKNDTRLEVEIVEKRTKLLGQMGMINFKGDHIGDVVIGEKKEININQDIHRTIALGLSEEQRQKLLTAMEDVGLVEKTK